MRRNVKLTSFGIALLVGAFLLGGWGWHSKDRPGMLGALCSVGFPNLSRPEAVDPDTLGCTILGPRQRVSGILMVGFESSKLVEHDLPPITGGTWWTRVGRQMNGDLIRQLKVPTRGTCGTHMASVVAYGWPTVSVGRFGHLGQSGREFYADKIISAGPPSAKFIAKYAAVRKLLDGLQC